jgi:hypothetical protein
MEINDFLWGFAMGLAAATLVGWFWGIYKGWIRQRDAFRRPQAVVQATPKTPAQVANEAARASSKIWFARFVFFVLIWVGVEILIPGLAAGIRSIIGNLLFGG